MMLKSMEGDTLDRASEACLQKENVPLGKAMYGQWTMLKQS